jgi:hypothetical protein
MQNIAALVQTPRVRAVVGVALIVLAALTTLALVVFRAPSIPLVTITAKDYSFQMPSSLPNGLVRVAFKNNGKQPHQANIARLNRGITKAKLEQQLQQHMDAALSMVTFVGGPNVVDPGGSQDVVLNLSQGEYVAICFVSDPTGMPHFMDGMISLFAVGGSNGRQPSTPVSNGTVTLKEFSITVPAKVTAGTYTWMVKNAGTQPHEMALLKLATGKSQSDALNFLEQQQPSGPPPFTDAGGMAALSPGGSAWVMVTLAKGNYLALCYVPDVHNGKPHFMEGMIVQLTVK